MKMHITLVASVLLMLSSCASVGTLSQSSANQMFEDGIYYNPDVKFKPVLAASSKEVSALAEKTKSSSVFATTPKLDTLIIPETSQFKDVTIFDIDPYHNWYYTGAFAAMYAWTRPWAWRYSWGYSPFYYDFWYWDRWAWYDPFWDPFWGPYWGPYWGSGWGYWDSYWWGPGPWGPRPIYIDPTPRVWRSPVDRPNFRSQNRPDFRAGGSAGSGGIGLSRNVTGVAAPRQNTSGTVSGGVVRSARGTSVANSGNKLTSERSIANVSASGAGQVTSTMRGGRGISDAGVSRTTVNGTLSNGRITRPTGASVSGTGTSAARQTASSSNVSRPVATSRPAGGQSVSRSVSGINRTTINSSSPIRSNGRSQGSATVSRSPMPQRSTYGGPSGGGGGSFRSAPSSHSSGVSRAPSGGGGGVVRSPR